MAGDKAVGVQVADDTPDVALAALAARLRAIEAALDEVLESTSDLAHLVDAEGRLVAVNRTWRQTLGTGSVAAADTSHIDAFLAPERRDAYHQACQRVVKGELGVTLAVTFRTWDHVPIEAVGRLTLQERETGPVVCGLFRNMTAQRFQESRQSHVALRDLLTNLGNHDYLLQHLPLALARAKRQGTLVGVVYINLDDFRAVNSYFGYVGGDETLIAVGDRLKRSVRTEDLTARIDGDQFVVVLERIHTAADATFVVERALAAIMTPILTHTGEWIRPRASIGVALATDPTDDTETLLRAAEGAMRGAKRAGGERFAFAERADAPAPPANALATPSA